MSAAPTAVSKPLPQRGDSLADLEQLLRDQVRAAGQKAGETGEVSAEQIESMARLKGLIEIARSLEPKARHRRWPVAAILVLALVLASFLFFGRMPSADVEMDFKVSEVAFELSRPYKLWDRLGVSVAGVSGVESIELPAMAGGTGAGGEFQVESESNGKRRGLANLEPLELPAKVMLRLGKTGVPHQYRLSFQSKGVEIRVDAIGPVAVSRPGAPPARFDFAIPQSIGSLSGSNATDLDFTPSQAPTGNFLQEVPIEKLSVSRVEGSSDGGQSMAGRVSTVLSGSTYFEALGTETAMRPAEEIVIGSAVGEIRTLALEDNDVALKFHGRVTGLSSGFEEAVRNLMPTRLEWLRAAHGLPLLWGTAVYLFTMAAAVIRWWGIDL